MGSTDLSDAPSADAWNREWTARAAPVADAAPLTVEFDRAGHHLTVYIAGELDAATADQLGHDVLARIHRGDKRVWLELSGVTFCGAAAVWLFIRLDERAAAAGARFALSNPSPQVRRLLEICVASSDLLIWTDRGR